MSEEENYVQCYSGYAYPCEPRAFVWEGRQWSVEAVVARWRTPAGPAFRVRVESDEFVLSYREVEDRWFIQPFSPIEGD